MCLSVSEFVRRSEIAHRQHRQPPVTSAPVHHSPLCMRERPFECRDVGVDRRQLEAEHGSSSGAGDRGGPVDWGASVVDPLLPAAVVRLR